MKQEGPKEIVIPEQRFLSCYGCDYHKSTLVKSGRDPQRAHNCEHPEFPQRASRFLGNLHENSDGHVEPPIDCPFRKKEQRDSAGTFGHGSSGQFMRTQIDFDGQNKDFEK